MTSNTVSNTTIYRELTDFRTETMQKFEREETRHAVLDLRLKKVEDVSYENHKLICGNGEKGMDEMIREIFSQLTAQEARRINDKQEAKTASENKTTTFRWWWEKVISPWLMPVTVAVITAYVLKG